MKLGAIGRTGRGRRSTEKDRNDDVSTFSNATVCAIIAIAGPLLVLPWCFGGTVFTSQFSMALGLCFALVVWIALQAGKWTAAPPIPMAMFPILFVIGLGVFQLTPLSSGILRSLSPTGMELWEQVQIIDPKVDSFAVELGAPRELARPSISLYPAATRQFIAAVLLPVSLFFLGVCFFHDVRWLVAVAVAVATNGAVLAFVGIAQQLRNTNNIYERASLEVGSTMFSTFLNRNNAAGYLNLCLAVGIGLLFWAAKRGKKADNPLVTPFQPAINRPWDRLVAAAKTNLLQTGLQLASLDGVKLFVFISLALILAGVLSASSRAGIFAVVVAFLVTSGAIIRRDIRGLRLSIGSSVIVVALGLGLVIGLGRWATIETRFQSLVSGDGLRSEGRFTHWRDGLSAGFSFWRTGAGLGTYGFTYPLYEKSPSELWWRHADNQFLELFVEAGAVGFIAVILAISLVAASALRLIHEPRDSNGYVLGVVGLFGLVTQIVQAFFDYGILLPANGCLFGLLCGSVVGMAIRLPKIRSGSRRWRFAWHDFLSIAIPHGRSLSASVATVFAIGLIWSVGELRAYSAVKSALSNVNAKTLSEPMSVERLNSEIGYLAATLAKRPDDVEGQIRLGELWIARYRALTLEQLRQQQPERSVNELWQLTAPLLLHRYSQSLLNQNRGFEWENLRASPMVQTNITAAARCLQKATHSSPLFGRPFLLLSELRPVISQIDCEEPWAYVARQRANADPRTMLEFGLLQVQRGQIEDGFQVWKTAIEQAPSSFVPLVKFAKDDPAMLDRVRILLPDDPQTLLRAARDEFPGDDNRPIRDILVARVRVMVNDGLVKERDEAYLRAVIATLESKTEEAIGHYSRALEQRPEMTDWRYEWALLLQKNGEIDRAFEQARKCRQTEPSNVRYENLIRELTRTSVQQ